MAFSLRDFLKKGFLNAVGSLPDYQIMLNAAGWLEKGVLTEDDLAEIQAAIDVKNAPPAPIVPDIPDTEPAEDSDNAQEVE